MSLVVAPLLPPWLAKTFCEILGVVYFLCKDVLSAELFIVPVFFIKVAFDCCAFDGVYWTGVLLFEV